MTKSIRLLALLLLCCAAISGCGILSGTEQALWMPKNEIISYTPIDTGKTVLTLGEYAGIDTTQIVEAIEEKFPDVDMVILKNSAGEEPQNYLQIQYEQDTLPDIIFGSSLVQIPGCFYDLSGEAFVSRYHLTALNSMSIDGKLYQIPCADTASGIWYNKTLFEEHGWTVPETREEFYTLCEEISKTGIRAFAPNLKYTSMLHNTTIGLAHDEIFSSVEKINQFSAFIQGEATADGLMEPALQMLQNLSSRKIITAEDFSSSITKTRQALYAGQVAMMPYGLDMDYFYRDEMPDCELGFFGFPTDNPGKRWLRMNTGSTMGIANSSMENPEKKKILLEIFDFLSTNEGQDVITSSLSGVSTVNGYSSNIAKTYPEIDTCLQNGTVFYMLDFGTTELLEMYQQITMGELSINEGIQVLNQFKRNSQPPTCLNVANYGTATETFTVLETSMLIADTMQKATNAQIALLPNLSYFKGNLAQIFKGDILLPERFYIKGLGAEDFLVTYEITGENLKALLEHPYINGTESNILYAFSGLKMEYAPWVSAEENVRKLTLADGSAIEDSATYTVAAWKTSIDDRYVSSIVQEFPELGDNVQLMSTEISAAKTISPPKDGRITLVWDQAE